MQNDFLSDYDIKDTIGKGTFSVVKLGINKTTKEKVAIKILKKNKILQNSDKSRLEREISILKKLNHINVIKSYKINEDSDKYYIVMEYCENGELFNYIVERQRLDENEASYFFYQLINGLDYIHHKNIVHRDLKPENLLLGKGNILKIVDFGLSNYCEEEKLLSTPCGSPCYASPEMVCGNKYNGLLIDIWSCGIIIFEMTCGFLPFEDVDNEILFKKIMKCKIEYPEFLSKNVLDIMKKILVVDPNKRISIPEIRKHPFYLRGKSIFENKHKELVCQVEKVNTDDEIENEIKIDESNGIEINKNKELNIKKSKSTNFIEIENIDINNDNNKKLYKNIFNKFYIEKKILQKENGSNSVTTNREYDLINDKNKIIKGLITKKIHISINSKDKDKDKDKDNINNETNKVMPINYEIKENKIEDPKNNSIKKITKNILGLIGKKNKIYTHKDNCDTNIINDLSTQNGPLSDDIHLKFYENYPKVIEGYEIIDKSKNLIIPQKNSKINLSLLQHLLKKGKTLKHNQDKNHFIYSPIIKKDKDNFSYILPPAKKQISEDKKHNQNSNTEYQNKIKSLNYEKINNNEQNDENANPSNRSEKLNNKSILSYSTFKKENNLNENNLKKQNKNKHYYNLELMKYGISNKDIKDILFKNTKNIKKIYNPNTTKNKPIFNLENSTNNEKNTNTNSVNNYNTGMYNNTNNIHIKNLRILNNNNYNNIKNITNINNVKSINNIIICNSPIKSLIKDVQYLTKINNNNDLPNINNNIHKEIKTLNNNNNNFVTMTPTQNKLVNSDPSNNNVLIPKILLTKDVNHQNLFNNYNTANLSKKYGSSLNQKLNSINKNINKKNNVNNLINNYRNSASSIDYLDKKSLSKKQISERNINSYGLDFINIENENNSINKKNNIVFTTKNKLNLNKIKSKKLDPFTYGRNNENLVTLKKINYHNNNINFNTANNNKKKVFPNN